ncbi:MULTISPECIES: Crp/Fnr family transcriptional regulator [Brevibacillus]|uniref:Transcriptional regulator n=1 Tax=Brevibacillus borstelensis AK1 TaxID=1300222 RepID=M8DDL5_9BACL|nr:Crp/Fnr family transcriptional regulator [Brevibacillus borstelensis]EMT51477.1 transcriptional regulator [Brevibacillus borstelensis AK1]KKX54991.1 transcriptional regulator [Brevibacillus borstelensis cifa_chp40]MCC0567122.1 Crp/Fnr family transcriptional regulator [Brevibacillus borstelensis]MCM3472173.1 Crp/Fnr family transcriptional regulator [Brevibacillus borstelensis]MCM3560444.1 Crp/Fnr family transcriptional regulator [Brevibacillus borstelensis]
MAKSLTFVQQISPDFLARLYTLATERNFPAGAVLYMDGDPAEYLYLISSGQVKLTKTTVDGKELTLQVFGSGELVGLAGLFEAELVHTASAAILEDGAVRVIPRAGLEQILIKNGEYCVDFMRWMGIMNRRMQSKFRDLLLNGKVGALYSTLIRMCNTYGEERSEGIYINLSLTNRDLAHFIGLTRESVNRMLSDLKKQQVIDLLPHGHILIKDLTYLKETICCDDCPPEICQI